MGEVADQELVASIARETVTRVAPEELMLFAPTADAYFKDPGRVGKPHGADDVLGFGGGAEMTFLTPIVLAVATEVVRFVIDEVTKAARTEGAAIIADRVHAVFARVRPIQPEQHAALELSEAQLVRVRTLAVERAIALNVPADRAALLADAMIGSLAAPA
jgi:hypothetical protein